MAIALLVSIGLAGAGWVFEAGRRLARAEYGAGIGNAEHLRERVRELEAEVAKLMAIVGASESHLRIERTAQQQLAGQIKLLQEENGRLKDDLVFFESLAAVSSGHGPSPTINRLQVFADGSPGGYRFRLLLVRRGGGRGDQDFRGSLQLVVSVLQAGKAAMIVFPENEDIERRRFEVSFRYFQRFDGAFRVPPDAQVNKVEVRLLQGDVTHDTESISL